MVTLSASSEAPAVATTSSDVGAPRRGWGVAGLSASALVLLGLVLAPRLVLWWRAEGFEQGDPVEYVNIAYKIAFGIGIEWWDLRPLLLSLIYVPVLYVAQLWPDPTGEAMVKALRLVGVAFATGATVLVYLLGRRLAGEIVGLGAGLLVGVNPIFNRLAVSTFAEVPSTCFVLLSVWLLVLAHERRSEVGARLGVARLAFGAGLALGVGCMIRYQAIFFLPSIGLWLVAAELAGSDGSVTARVRTLLGRRSSIVWFGAGLGVAAIAQGAIEWIAYGQAYHSLIASFDYNMTSGLAPVEFGAEPFDWFLRETPAWFGIVPGILAIVGALAMLRGPRAAEWRLVGLTAAMMFLALSALPHKEDRFMAQVLPLLALFAAHGAALLGYRFQRLPWGPSASRDPHGVTGYRLQGRVALPLPRAGDGSPLARLRERGGGGVRASTVIAVALLLVGAVPLLRASWTLDLTANLAYVDGPKRAAQIKPGGVIGTIPWFVPRPYTGTRLTLTRMDRNVWKDRELVARTIEESDFLLFPEYWLLEDREIDKLVDARFRSIRAYDNGVVLYESRQLEEPARRRSRP